MLIKTSELEGPALDWAVSVVELAKLRASGEPVKQWVEDNYRTNPPAYGADWLWTGPILEQENIWPAPHHTSQLGHHFTACKWNEDGDIGKFPSSGKTPFVAALRCYVAGRLGPEVDVPDNLVMPAGIMADSPLPS